MKAAVKTKNEYNDKGTFKNMKKRQWFTLFMISIMLGSFIGQFL